MKPLETYFLVETAYQANDLSNALDDIDKRLQTVDSKNIDQLAVMADCLKKIIRLFGGKVVQSDKEFTIFRICTKEPCILKFIGTQFMLHNGLKTVSVRDPFGDTTQFNVLGKSIKDLRLVYPGEYVIKVNGFMNKNQIYSDSSFSIEIEDSPEDHMPECSSYYLVDLNEIDIGKTDFGFFSDDMSINNLESLAGRYIEEKYKFLKVPMNFYELDDYSFSNAYSMQNLYFSNKENLSAIGSDSFVNCAQLTSVVLPDGLQWIGQDSFANCENIEKIVIPSSLTAMFDGVFEACEDKEIVMCLDPALSACNTVRKVKEQLKIKYPQPEHKQYTDEDFEYYSNLISTLNFDDIVKRLEKNCKYRENRYP